MTTGPPVAWRRNGTLEPAAKGPRGAIGGVLFSVVFLVAFLFQAIQAYPQQLVLEQETGWYWHDHDVEIYPLKVNGKLAGHSIWLARRSERVKAKYFASGKVGEKYRQWSSTRNVILVCSGAFTNIAGTPLGITVDNGIIVNRQREYSMDGLVIVYATGGIVVSDIEKRYLKIQRIGQVDVENPADLNKMLRWAETDVATIFQTQLLAFNNRLRLTVSQARKKLRERRILVLSRQNGQVYHIIFNITPGVYLGDISHGILSWLNRQGGEVVAMMNLDTGMYDSFRVHLPVPGGIEGDVDPSDATNLLAYYYE